MLLMNIDKLIMRHKSILSKDVNCLIFHHQDITQSAKHKIFSYTKQGPYFCKTRALISFEAQF